MGRVAALLVALLAIGAIPAQAPVAAGQDAQSYVVHGTRFRAHGPVSEPPRIRARSWVVADLTSGRLLGVRRPHRRLPMASTIKLLTAITATRTVPALPDHRVTKREAHPEWCTCAGLKVGRQYTRRALLAGALLPSGNDAAEALAGSHPAGRHAFYDAMNATAASLGATGTYAANASGLTAPGGRSTARDLLLFLRAAQADPVVEPILDLARFRFGPRGGRKHWIYRANDYVNKHVTRWPGTQGKSGFTTPAKNTLVVATPIKGRLIAVAILGAPPGRITKAAVRLTRWASRNYASLAPVGRLPR